MANAPEFEVRPEKMSSYGEASPSFHQQVLGSLPDGVYFVDRERKIQYWNKAAERLTGYASGEIVGRFCFENLLVHVDGTGCTLCLDGCPLAKSIADGESREAEVYLRHKLGHRVPVLVRVAPITDDSGNIVGAVEVFSDSSVRENFERRVGELENIAFLDALTGVPNRRYIETKVKQALEDARQFGRKAGLLMIDVDHFKNVNDNYGHEAGDEALKAICRTIMHSLRLGDVLGRWGGEEFLLIVRDVTLKSMATVAEKLRMLIAESVISGSGKNLHLTVSVGATLIKKRDSDQSVIKRADGLMYKSKAAGRNRVTVG